MAKLISKSQRRDRDRYLEYIPWGKLRGVWMMGLMIPSLMGLAQTNQMAEDIRDIRGPVHIPIPWLWGLLIIAFLLGLVLAIVVGIWIYKAATKKQKARQRLPHEICLDRLLAAADLMAPETSREFCIQVSDAIREYLEIRFQERATHHTTEEFLHQLLNTPNSPLTPYSASLGDFLNHCDLAKFARQTLMTQQMQAMLTSARMLVEETKPTLPTSSAGSLPAKSGRNTPPPLPSN